MNKLLYAIYLFAMPVWNAVRYPFSWSVELTVEVNPFVKSFWQSPKWGHVKGSIYHGAVGPFSISGMRFA